METPVGELALGLDSLAAGGSARRSPFSPNNAVTTDWKSDPAKTNDLLRDIAKVLHSPIPSPAGYVRRLDGDFHKEASPLQPQLSSEQSAKDLVASLEKLLQKGPATDGQTALQTLRSTSSQQQLLPNATLPSPQPSSPSAAAAGARGSTSRWQFLASRAASFKAASSPGGSPAAAAALAGPVAASSSEGHLASVAALLDQISAVASPSASAAASPAASPPRLPPAAAPASEPSSSPGYLHSLSLPVSPYSSPPPLGGATSPAPTLSRWQSPASRTVPGKGPAGSLGAAGYLVPSPLGMEGGHVHPGGRAAVPPLPPAALARSLPQSTVQEIMLPLAQLDWQLPAVQGLRFEQEAGKVAAELEAYAALEATMAAQFQTAIAQRMGQLFTLPG